MDGVVPFFYTLYSLLLSAIIYTNYPRDESYPLSVVCDHNIKPPE